MNPGRELDALVAEKVMGWKRVEKPHKFGTGITIHLRAPGKPEEPNTVCEYITGDIAAPCLPSEFIPKYSTDIAAAWYVVEKIKHNGPAEAKDMDATLTIEEADGEWWVGWRWHEWTGDGASAQSAPHAICLAALKAVGVEV